MKPVADYWNNCPSRINETWEWFCAVCAYDYGDSASLADLVRTQHVPEEYRSAIADIVAGARKPNRRAAAKLKVPAAEMMQIAAHVAVIIGLADDVKKRNIVFDAPAGMVGAAAYGWAKRKEPVEIIKQANSFIIKAYETAAESLGVSTETVENALREMRRRIAKWPDV